MAAAVLLHRRHGAVVLLAGADADDPLERHDEYLAVTYLAGACALAEGVDRRLDERIGHGDLEPDLLGQPHLHGRAAVGLDPVELTSVALDPAQGDPAHLGAVQGLQNVIGLLRAHHADHELQGSPPPSPIRERAQHSRLGTGTTSLATAYRR